MTSDGLPRNVAQDNSLRNITRMAFNINESFPVRTLAIQGLMDGEWETTRARILEGRAKATLQNLGAQIAALEAQRDAWLDKIKKAD